MSALNQEIQSIAEQNKTSKAVIEALGSRRRHRDTTDVRQMMYRLINEGNEINKDELIQTFKNLEKAGVGSLVIGRRNKPTRFKWSYNVLQLMQPEKFEEKPPVVTEKRKRGRPRKTEITPQKEKVSGYDVIPEKLRHALLQGFASKTVNANLSIAINLSHGKQARLEIPVGISKEETAKLVEFTKAITSLK